MRNKAGTSLLILFSLLFSGCVASSEREQSVRHAIVVAKITSVRFVEDMQPEYPGDIPVGSFFQVGVSDVQVARGEVPFDIRSLRLAATHKEALEARGRIAVFLEVDLDGVNPVYWEDVYSTTCFDDDLWKGGDLDGKWDYEEKSRGRSDSRSCIYLND